jgi:hypothetical protein
MFVLAAPLSEARQAFATKHGAISDVTAYRRGGLLRPDKAERPSAEF